MRVERVILGAVLVGSMGIQWWTTREQREALALLQAEVDRVSTSVEQLRRASSIRWGDPPVLGAPTARVMPEPLQAPPTASAAPVDEPEEPEPQQRPAAVRFDADAARAHVERTFERESSDSGWASDAQREVRENVSTHLPTTASVRTMDCRATLCRLEVDFPVEADFQETMGRPGALSRLWKGPSMARIERDATRGSVTIIGYLVRPGHPMPVEAPDGAQQD